MVQKKLKSAPAKKIKKKTVKDLTPMKSTKGGAGYGAGASKAKLNE